MGAREQLRVRVNDDLVLDAGTCEEVSGPDGPERLIRPPETTLFHQVLAYLRAKPDPPVRPRGSAPRREGVAAAAVVLRWGSYLAVLLDCDKPIWAAAARPDGTSRISDEEMARINIEASAALAEWIDLHRASDGRRLYATLVDRAVCYLPKLSKAPEPAGGPFAALADRETGARLVGASDPARVALVRADAERHASRLFSNALVNVGRTGKSRRSSRGRPTSSRLSGPTARGSTATPATETPTRTETPMSAAGRFPGSTSMD
jgi:hypothetical protein